MLDLAVIGAGPCGLAVGVAAKRAHLACSLFDKGPVVSSLLRYPLYMTFFSTPERLEIGVPFVTAGDKPRRRDALGYYRRVAEHFELDVRQYHEVVRVERTPQGFELVARHPGAAAPETISTRHVVCAPGYFGSTNLRRGRRKRAPPVTSWARPRTSSRPLCSASPAKRCRTCRTSSSSHTPIGSSASWSWAGETAPSRPRSSSLVWARASRWCISWVTSTGA